MRLQIQDHEYYYFDDILILIGKYHFYLDFSKLQIFYKHPRRICIVSYPRCNQILSISSPLIHYYKPKLAAYFPGHSLSIVGHYFVLKVVILLKLLILGVLLINLIL